MQPHTLFRIMTGIAACAMSTTLVAAKEKRVIDHGVEPVHQPTVERTDFIFDVVPSSDGTLGTTEVRRLNAWFNALGLRYGDRVSLADTGGPDLAGSRNAIADLVARYGLLTGGEAPLTVGEPAPGSLRVVVSRSTATVEGCPSWRDPSQTDLVGGLSDNYGCAMASNLAAMAADPQDLVEGRRTDTDLRTATGSRAIRVYQDKEPTGAGALQVMSAGGK